MDEQREKDYDTGFKHGRESVQSDVERLRIELVETRDKYSQICERLWTIVHDKRIKKK